MIIKNIEFSECYISKLSSFRKGYQFDIICEIDNQEYIYTVKISVELLPFEEILKDVINSFVKDIFKKFTEKAEEQIWEKMNENEDILKLRMMNKLME